MKKVLYVATVDIHIEKFHLPYLKLLHENGYEVHVATNGDEQFPYCDVKHQICIERNPFKLHNLKAIKQLKKIIDDEKFDLIHCHTPMGSVVARLAAKKARKKYGTRVIYTAHGFHFYKGAPKFNWMLFYPIEKWLAKYTDTLITINKEDYELAKKKFSRRCKDIEYIHGIGIEEKRFNVSYSKKDKDDLLKSMGLNHKDIILTCVARLDKNKNQGLLINMMRELLIENDKIHLLLVGPDELNGYYYNMVNDFGLSKNIHFLGRREDIPEILSITDIVVSASLREGLPVNVLEALASGKPVVAYSCRGMKDLIDNGKNGYIVNNSIDMKNRIIDIVDNNMMKIDINCKNKITDFSLNTVIGEMKQIYFQKKRILHLLATNKYSGAENVACTIINNMKDKYDFYYCSPEGNIVDKINDLNINYKPLNKLSYKEIKKVVKSINPDIIHAHDFRATYIACLFSKKCTIISQLHKNDPQMKKVSLKSILYLFSSMKIDKILGVSDSILNEYIFKKSIYKKYITLANHVDIEKIKKEASLFDVDTNYDLCFFGRLSDEKNPLDFIEIIYKLKKTLNKCIIIGDGPLSDECIRMINKYELQDIIDMIGFQSNPFPYVKASKICIMPSKYEGFGLAAIEALALGKPVLNSGVGGLKKIFENNVDMVCNNLNDYITKINYYLNHHHKINFIADYYDREKYIETLSQIYE